MVKDPNLRSGLLALLDDLLQIALERLDGLFG
jgi:hypothetical protein